MRKSAKKTPHPKFKGSRTIENLEDITICAEN